MEDSTSSVAQPVGRAAKPRRKGSEKAPPTWAVVQPADAFDSVSVCAFEGDPKDGLMDEVICEVMAADEEGAARLIAAAPDLLEACRAMIAASDGYVDTPLDDPNRDDVDLMLAYGRALDLIRAAIALALATGREA